MAKWTYNGEEGRLCCDGGEWFELAALVYGPDDAVEQLLADANRGAEAAAYDKAIDAAGDAAAEQALKLTPAALAHGLVRDAIGVLVGGERGGALLGASVLRALRALAKSLAWLDATLGSEAARQVTAAGMERLRLALSQVPPQPIEQAIEEAHGGLTAEAAEE